MKSWLSAHLNHLLARHPQLGPAELHWSDGSKNWVFASATGLWKVCKHSRKANRAVVLPGGETLRLVLPGQSNLAWCRRLALKLYRRQESRWNSSVAGLQSAAVHQRRQYSDFLHQGVSQQMTANTLLLELACSALPTLSNGSQLQEARLQARLAGKGLRQFFDRYLQPNDEGDFVSRLYRLTFCESSLEVRVPEKLEGPAEPRASMVLEVIYNWLLLSHAHSPRILHRHFPKLGKEGLVC